MRFAILAARMSTLRAAAIMGITLAAAGAQTTVSLYGPIVSVAGTNNFPVAIGHGYQALAVSWSQGSATRVTISAPINGSGSTVTAYLTTRIGPGTTVANQIAQTTVLNPNDWYNFKDTSLFTFASLPAGTYFLTLNANVTDGGWAGSFPVSPSSITTQAGDSANGYYVSGSGAAGSVAAYPPASNFVGPGPNILFFAVTGTTQVQVPFGDLYCPAGSNGLGDIYDPFRSTCASGVVVPFADSYCPAGRNGPGYIYNPATSFCVGGIALPFGDLYCPAGVNGPGDIYAPGISYCASGVVVPFLDLYCPAGVNGKGYIYDPTASSCASGAIVPILDSYCSAGINGAGGVYDQTKSTCAGGVIVPDGGAYCPPGVNGPGGIYTVLSESCVLGAISLAGATPSVVPPTQVAISASGLTYSRVSQTYSGTVTFKNISSTAISGPFEILFTQLPVSVTLVNASASLSGWPFWAGPALASLAPGQSVTVSVQFMNPPNVAIHFTAVLYHGSLN